MCSLVARRRGSVSLISHAPRRQWAVTVHVLCFRLFAQTIQPTCSSVLDTDLSFRGSMRAEYCVCDRVRAVNVSFRGLRRLAKRTESCSALNMLVQITAVLPFACRWPAQPCRTIINVRPSSCIVGRGSLHLVLERIFGGRRGSWSFGGPLYYPWHDVLLSPLSSSL